MGDYKSRNPVAPTWPFSTFTAWRTPEPYDVLSAAGAFETDTPDLSAVLLMKSGSMSPENNSMIMFAIESPPHSPIRRAFEWGEISWLDFWSHKDWLLRINLPFDRGPVTSRYITPAEMHGHSPKAFQHLDGKFPFGLKKEQLELRCEDIFMTKLTKKKRELAEADYQKFMARYGHRFLNDAA
jgi:hypothetical protein